MVQLVKAFPSEAVAGGGDLELLQLSMSLWRRYPSDPLVVEVRRGERDDKLTLLLLVVVVVVTLLLMFAVGVIDVAGVVFPVVVVVVLLLLMVVS